MRGPIPVTVVTGFLGAGKSTLLERWLAEQTQETAVILNEWGEIGIDAELLGRRRGRLIELTGGCLCCTNQAELARGLATLAAAKPTPARILVETSGAASPAGVVRAVTTGPARDDLRLDGVVTVVDGARVDRVLTFDLAVEQLGFADVVVIAHADEVPDVKPVVAKLIPYAPVAVMAQAEHGMVHLDDRSPTLLELLDERREVLHTLPDDAPHHEAIDAVSLHHDGELDEERFLDWVTESLAELEARILRIKGILAMRGIDARVILQGVGEAVDVRLGSPWTPDEPRQSRLVILGLGLDAADLERGFAACATE